MLAIVQDNQRMTYEEAAISSKISKNIHVSHFTQQFETLPCLFQMDNLTEEQMRTRIYQRCEGKQTIQTEPCF